MFFLSQDPELGERVAPMHAEHAFNPHARRIAADAQREWVCKIPDETGKCANIPRIDAFRGLDFNERLRKTGAFDHQIDFRSGAGSQVGKPPVGMLVSHKVCDLGNDEVLKRLAIFVGTVVDRYRE